MDFVTALSEKECQKVVEMYKEGMNLRQIREGIVPNRVVEGRLIRQIVIDNGLGVRMYCKWCEEHTDWIAQVRGGIEACNKCGRTMQYRDGQV